MRLKVAIAQLERRLAKRAKRVERLIQEVGKIEAVLDALKEAEKQRVEATKATPELSQSAESTIS